MKKLKNFRLKSKEDRRFKQGHPWVFSNELQDSPNGIEAGELVELHDASGAFLAYGMGNPNSLIAFRELSRDRDSPHLKEGELQDSFFYHQIKIACAFRKSWFSSSQSYRFIFGEADGLSGLIIDRYIGRDRVAYVVQPHSAGMDRNLDLILKSLAKISIELHDPKDAVAILRRDAGSREREGLTKELTEIKELSSGKILPSSDPYREFYFQVPGVMGTSLELKTDLVSGQKTGFFFDQLQNIRLLETLLLRKLRRDQEGAPGARAQSHPVKKTYQLLDLCSYVGQWSVHLMQTLMEREALPLEITCVDASENALKTARANIENFANAHQIQNQVEVNTLKLDVLQSLNSIEDQSYDLVIADPPAFIKNRKSIPQGKQAYSQLFQAAIEKTAPGGLVVCCSCSQLLSHEEFMEVLGKATRRSKRRVRWLLEGSPSFDHFTRLEFQEGHYLKCFVGQVEEVPMG